MTISTSFIKPEPFVRYPEPKPEPLQPKAEPFVRYIESNPSSKTSKTKLFSKSRLEGSKNDVFKFLMSDEVKQSSVGVYDKTSKEIICSTETSEACYQKLQSYVNSNPNSDTFWLASVKGQDPLLRATSRVVVSKDGAFKFLTYDSIHQSPYYNNVKHSSVNVNDYTTKETICSTELSEVCYQKLQSYISSHPNSDTFECTYIFGDTGSHIVSE